MKIVKLTNDTKQNLLETLLKRSTNDYGDYEKVVAEIIEAVKERKEEAVFEYSLKFDNAPSQERISRSQKRKLRQPIKN